MHKINHEIMHNGSVSALVEFFVDSLPHVVGYDHAPGVLLPVTLHMESMCDGHGFQTERKATKLIVLRHAPDFLVAMQMCSYPASGRHVELLKGHAILDIQVPPDLEEVKLSYREVRRGHVPIPPPKKRLIEVE